jgi:hypothetical protein
MALAVDSVRRFHGSDVNQLWRFCSMKRLFLFVLPVLATVVVLGVGAYALRSHPIAIRPRLGAAREAIASAIETVAEEVEEAIE